MKRYPATATPDPPARRKGPGFKEIAASAPTAKDAAAQRIRLESLVKITIDPDVQRD
jgi:hypothetical protein